MLKFFRAASVAAVTFTLVSAVITADAGFAFGNNQSTALNATTIVVDAAQISADQVQADLAKSGKVTATLRRQWRHHFHTRHRRTCEHRR